VKGGTWVTKDLWLTTEPVEEPSGWWRRVVEAVRGREAPFEGEVRAGTTLGDHQRSMEKHHNAALAAGFESELSVVYMPRKSPGWQVVVRRPGETLPPFHSDGLAR
jgi:hypothetical protein